MQDILRFDVDSSLLEQWQRDFVKSRTAYIESLGYRVQRIIIRPSGETLPWQQNKTRGKGFHVWVHIRKDVLPEASDYEGERLSDMRRLQLQFLLGDDPGRIWINYLRITKRQSPLWDKIFGYITSRSPLPEPCNSCRLRFHLEELKKEEENASSDHQGQHENFS
jgi:hypothetical protein